MPEPINPTPEQMQKMFAEMQKKENEGLTPEEIEVKNREREEKKQRNLSLLNETLEICQKGSYERAGKTVPLGPAPDRLSAARVFLPAEVRNLPSAGAEDAPLCTFSCENKDALTLAREKSRNLTYRDESGRSRILLLNLASAVRPGGGVRNGMGGQEESLCRDSTLLMSLESEAAKPYYEYNNKRNTHMGSDGLILSPEVIVFRDEKGELLDEPFSISVISCAAPNVRFGFEGMSKEEYQKMLYRRIEGILRCAGNLGYKNLILGAFGCGAFRNDAALVSDCFCRALTGEAGRGLAHADFAVLCTPGKEYNFREFCRNFA